MRDYELMVVVSPDISDEDFPATVEKVSQFITKAEGEIVEAKQWGRRRLAYPINHFDDGNYILITFKLVPESVAEVEKKLLLSEEILRHIVIKK